ncbi:hypothetical protein Aperf_G00000126905 [Anoplocephala perfoliata]
MAKKPYRHRSSGKFNYVNRWIKYLLCVTNFYFMIAGCLFFILGVIAFAESGIINRKSSISLLQWIFNLTVIVFGVGFVTTCVAFTGFIGSLRENLCLLKFYYISLALLFVCETIIGIFFFVYRESAINRIEEVAKKTFISQYREIGFEDSTKFVDFLQVELQCCGAKSYNDWTENRYFSCNATNFSSKACGVPYSCCKRMNNINENVINTSCGHGVQNLSPPQASPLVWTVGCVQALASLLESNVVAVSCVISGIAVLQLLAILLAKALYTQIGDQLRLLQHESLLR